MSTRYGPSTTVARPSEDPQTAPSSWTVGLAGYCWSGGAALGSSEEGLTADECKAACDDLFGCNSVLFEGESGTCVFSSQPSWLTEDQCSGGAAGESDNKDASPALEDGIRTFWKPFPQCEDVGSPTSCRHAAKSGKCISEAVNTVPLCRKSCGACEGYPSSSLRWSWLTSGSCTAEVTAKECQAAAVQIGAPDFLENACSTGHCARMGCRQNSQTGEVTFEERHSHIACSSYHRCICRDEELLFDPSSTLVSYVDEGNCGPRGNDATAESAECGLEKDMRVVEKAQSVTGDPVATINGCNYLSYVVYECLGGPGRNPKLGGNGDDLEEESVVTTTTTALPEQDLFIQGRFEVTVHNAQACIADKGFQAEIARGLAEKVDVNPDAVRIWAQIADLPRRRLFVQQDSSLEAQLKEARAMEAAKAFENARAKGGLLEAASLRAMQQPLPTSAREAVDFFFEVEVKNSAKDPTGKRSADEVVDALEQGTSNDVTVSLESILDKVSASSGTAYKPVLTSATAPSVQQISILPAGATSGGDDDIAVTLAGSAGGGGGSQSNAASGFFSSLGNAMSKAMPTIFLVIGILLAIAGVVSAILAIIFFCKKGQEREVSKEHPRLSVDEASRDEAAMSSEALLSRQDDETFESESKKTSGDYVALPEEEAGEEAGPTIYPEEPASGDLPETAGQTILTTSTPPPTSSSWMNYLTGLFSTTSSGGGSQQQHDGHDGVAYTAAHEVEEGALSDIPESSPVADGDSAAPIVGVEPVEDHHAGLAGSDHQHSAQGHTAATWSPLDAGEDPSGTGGLSASPPVPISVTPPPAPTQSSAHHSEPPLTDSQRGEISQLEEMGFSTAQARRALERTHWNQADAMELLFAGAVDEASSGRSGSHPSASQGVPSGAPTSSSRQHPPPTTSAGSRGSGGSRARGGRGGGAGGPGAAGGGAAAGGAALPPQKREAVDLLMSMGFEEPVAISALEGADWDLTRATNHLLAG